MLTERNIVGKIEILEDGQIQLREDNVIERDGIEVHRTYHRRVLEPGQDMSTESPRVRQVTQAVWTDEVIRARQKALENTRIVP